MKLDYKLDKEGYWCTITIRNYATINIKENETNKMVLSVPKSKFHTPTDIRELVCKENPLDRFVDFISTTSCFNFVDFNLGSEITASSDEITIKDYRMNCTIDKPKGFEIDIKAIIKGFDTNDFVDVVLDKVNELNEIIESTNSSSGDGILNQPLSF